MNTTINCLIIDDEPLARDLIRTFLLSRKEFLITGECIHPAEAYELLLNNDIDVIFLDIQMPVLSGVDFLRSLKYPPKVIFTTAYADYAASAFDLNAVDYLVKPITEERFEIALEKLKQALNISSRADERSMPADHIFFKIDGKLVKVQFDEILYLEAKKDFTKVVLKNEKNLLVGSHLKAVEELLPGSLFIRAHRSFVISVKAVSGIFGNTVEVGKVQLPVGAVYKEQLFSILNIS